MNQNDAPVGTLATRYTKFERSVIRWTDTLVFFFTMWALAWLFITALVALWPDVITTPIWVQIGWVLLIGVAAYIPAGIVSGLAERQAKYWADRRVIERWSAWLSDQWDVNR